MADGLHKCLSGEVNIAEFPQEEIEAAFGEARVRAEALENEASEIPTIRTASLEKIGAVIVMQSGLVQLGFGSGEADSIVRDLLWYVEAGAALKLKCLLFKSLSSPNWLQKQNEMVLPLAMAVQDTADQAPGKFVS